MGKPDPKLLEMAEVFHMPKAARMKYIILPARMSGIARLLNGKSKTTADRLNSSKKARAITALAFLRGNRDGQERLSRG